MVCRTRLGDGGSNGLGEDRSQRTGPRAVDMATGAGEAPVGVDMATGAGEAPVGVDMATGARTGARWDCR